MDVRKVIDQANALRKAGNHLAAEELYDKVVQFDPLNGEVYYCKGLNCLDDDALQAIALFKKAVLLDGTLTGAFNNIAVAAYDDRLHAEAIEAFDELRAKYPTNLDLFYYRAIEVGRSGNYLDALLDLYFVLDQAELDERGFLDHKICDDIASCKTEIRNSTCQLNLDYIEYYSELPPKEYHYPLPAKQFGDENFLLEFGKYMGRNISEVLRDQPDYIYWCIENLDNFCVSEDVIALLEKKGLSNKRAYDLNLKKLQVGENSKRKFTIDGPLPSTIQLDANGNIIP